MDINFVTGGIIGAALEVHKMLGPGLLESAYEECLAKEIKDRGFIVERQVPLPVVYKDIKLDCGYRLDLLVNRSVIVEVKSIDGLLPVHEAQILTYLKFSGMKVGLLFNFNITKLMNGFRRFIM